MKAKTDLCVPIILSILFILSNLLTSAPVQSDRFKSKVRHGSFVGHDYVVLFAFFVLRPISVFLVFMHSARPPHH